MSDSKAAEKELNGLHGALARFLREQLDAKATIIGEDGKEQVVSMVAPSMVGHTIKFLKDNNITAVMEVGDDMDALSKMLKDKPKRGREQLQVVPAKAAAQE